MAQHFPKFTNGWHQSVYPALKERIPEGLLRGKSAIVTGAAGGIGKAISRAFAEAEASFVVLVGRTENTLTSFKNNLEKEFPKTRFIVEIADTANREALDEALKRAREQIGKPFDILTANAGYLATSGPVESSDPLDWWQTFETNMRGTYNQVHTFLPLAALDAVIFNTTSAGAHCPPRALPGTSAYASSKIAGLKFFEHVQAEKPEMRIFSVHPGVVASDMQVKSGLPILDDAALVANIYLWMYTGDADFLKGKMIWANWDIDELKAMSKEIEGTTMLTASVHGWPIDGPIKLQQ